MNARVFALAAICLFASQSFAEKDLSGDDIFKTPNTTSSNDCQILLRKAAHAATQLAVLDSQSTNSRQIEFYTDLNNNFKSYKAALQSQMQLNEAQLTEKILEAMKSMGPFAPLTAPRDFTADELTAIREAAKQGMASGLTSPKFLNQLLRTGGTAAHTIVLGLLLGARDWDKACAAIGSRCYNLGQNLEGTKETESAILVTLIKNKVPTALVRAYFHNVKTLRPLDFSLVISSELYTDVASDLLKSFPLVLGQDVADKPMLFYAINNRNVTFINLVAQEHPSAIHDVEIYQMAAYPEFNPIIEDIIAKKPEKAKIWVGGNRSLLYMAASNENIELMQYLAKCGVKLDANQEYSPLLIAITNQKLKSVETLINLGASVDHNKGGADFIGAAVATNKIEFVRTIVFAGAPILDSDIAAAAKIERTSDGPISKFLKANK